MWGQNNTFDSHDPLMLQDRQTDGQTTCNLNTVLRTSASRDKNGSSSDPLHFGFSHRTGSKTLLLVRSNLRWRSATI